MPRSKRTRGPDRKPRAQRSDKGRARGKQNQRVGKRRSNNGTIGNEARGAT